MAENFEEKSGLAASNTPWGNWAQTIEDIHIEVELKQKTSSKDISCTLNTSHISVIVNKETIVEGMLYNNIKKDESIWTLEDQTLIRIVLQKLKADATNCWKSLLKNGDWPVDPATLDNMEKKLTLERFQRENPGFDFSKADITGNYKGGGPNIS